MVINRNNPGGKSFCEVQDPFLMKIHTSQFNGLNLDFGAEFSKSGAHLHVDFESTWNMYPALSKAFYDSKVAVKSQ